MSWNFLQSLHFSSSASTCRPMNTRLSGVTIFEISREQNVIVTRAHTHTQMYVMCCYDVMTVGKRRREIKEKNTQLLCFRNK